METERIALSQRERDRLRVLHEVEQGHLAQIEAARRMKLTDRQVRRLLRGLAGARRSRGAPWASGGAVESQVGGTLRATGCGPQPPKFWGLWGDLCPGTPNRR